MSSSQKIKLALSKMPETGRSDISRVREIFDEIQAALEKGHTLTTVVGTLNAKGFSISLESLKTSMRRIRQERKQKDE